MSSSSRSLLFVTGNKGKAAEVAAIIGWDVDPVKLDLAEIQSLSVEEVAAAKAMEAYRQLQRPVVVDDSGMTIDALSGLPGALLAWFLDTLGPDGILKLIDRSANRRASVSTCIGYADAEGAKTFLGVIEGQLTTERRGANGFGYDPIFIPDGQQLTFAEMSSEQKNAHSMRSIALLRLKAFLEAR
ncbi:MAG: RdgB/HAM1 family non-canonical purine NTP pyrophosphatase [Vicinamibacterales bacterium]